MPTVSAIVCTRNAERFLADALASIAAQSVPVDEILVLDGDSGDATRAIAAAHARVRLVSQSGLGLAVARNQAIMAARGDILAFLDHDDRWTPLKTESQLALLARQSRPAMALGALQLFRAEHANGELALDAPRMARTPGVLLADRVVFDRVGRFDTALTTGCDMDWFARAAAAGIPTAATDDVVLLKRLHDANLSRDIARNRAEAFAVLAKRRGLQRTPR